MDVDLACDFVQRLDMKALQHCKRVGSHMEDSDLAIARLMESVSQHRHLQMSDIALNACVCNQTPMTAMWGT